MLVFVEMIKIRKIYLKLNTLTWPIFVWLIRIELSSAKIVPFHVTFFLINRKIDKSTS